MSAYVGCYCKKDILYVTLYIYILKELYKTPINTLANAGEIILMVNEIPTYKLNYLLESILKQKTIFIINCLCYECLHATN